MHHERNIEAEIRQAQRAAHQGYLQEGGTIRFAVDSDHSQWKDRLEGQLVTALEPDDTISVTIAPVAAEELDLDDEDDDDSEVDDEEDDDWEDDPDDEDDDLNDDHD